MLIMCSINPTQFIQEQLKLAEKLIEEGELVKAYKIIVETGNQIEFEKSKLEDSTDELDIESLFGEYENQHCSLNRRLLREMSRNL